MPKKALGFSLFWAFLFAVGLSFEGVLSLEGRTLCEREACQVVNSFAKLSHEHMVFLGIAYLIVLSTFSALVLRGYSRWKIPLVVTASAGLGAETVFLLRQVFDYHVLCPFCLVVAVGVLGSAIPILWFLGFQRVGLEGIAGVILGVASAFFITGVSLEPVLETSPTHSQKSSEEVVLVYSSDCPHCHEVLDFCERVGIDITLCPKEKAIGLLRLLGLKGVPVLLVKKPFEVQVIQGSNQIIAFLERNFRAAEPRPNLSLFPEEFVFPQDEGVCPEGIQSRCN